MERCRSQVRNVQQAEHRERYVVRGYQDHNSSHIYVPLIGVLYHIVLGQCLRIVFKACLATKTTLVGLRQKMVASLLAVIQDGIGAGLKDERQDRENRWHAMHVGCFLDASKTLVEVGINVCWD